MSKLIYRSGRILHRVSTGTYLGMVDARESSNLTESTISPEFEKPEQALDWLIEQIPNDKLSSVDLSWYVDRPAEDQKD